MRKILKSTLIAVLLAGSLAVPSSATHLAAVEGRVTEAARNLRAGQTLDLMISLDRVASSGLRAQLARLGTWSWSFKHIPVAAVRLPVARLGALRRLAGVRGVYLNRQLEYMLKESAARMNTAHAWNDLKVTGKGVTVAILDSGVDFTHPDLAPAMKANVKLVEYGAPTPVIPIEGIPNSDTSSGHGTHVAGDVAGRGIKSNGDFKGMAYGADLVGVGAGDVLFIFTVIEGFDYVIEHKDDYGIRAVNNSWGTEFEPFDVNNPVNIATKAAHDAGIVVLFAMGNSYDELTMNPYAAAPWVIPVAAGTKTGSVTDFSSGGIEADTASLVFDGKAHTWDRAPLGMGRYHPSVTSTGENVISTRANNTVLPLTAADQDIKLSPTQLPYYTTFSGTSMATPETAGVVALILEANPELTPDQVRHVLEVTARPVKDVPFYKQGYGYTDASAAVELALSLKRTAGPVAARATSVADTLKSLRATVDARWLKDIKPAKLTYAWQDPATTGPVTAEHPIQVTNGLARIKIVSDGPSTVEVNVAAYDIEVTDAAGNAVGSSLNFPIAQSLFSGTTVLDLDLHNLGASEAESADKFKALKWGTWTVTVSSPLAPGGPMDGIPVDDLPKTTMQTVVSLFADLPGPTCGPISVFVPSKPIVYRFQDDDASGVPYPANPSYTYVGPVPNGTLGARSPARNLAATFGILQEVPGPRVRFETPVLTAPMTIGLGGLVETWIQTPSEPVRGILGAELLDVAPDDSVETIGTLSGDVGAEGGTAAPAQTKALILISKPYTIAKGHRLAVDMGVTFIGTLADELLYDSDEYPSGLTITPGSIVTKDPCAAGSSVRGTKVVRPRPAPNTLPATGVADREAMLFGLLGIAFAIVVRRRLART